MGVARREATRHEIVTRIDDDWVREHFPDLVDVAQLAPGGQKTVFAATHPTHGSVVLKAMRPIPQHEKRAPREIEAVTKIKSPLVPKIFDHGTVDGKAGGTIWLLEERIAGKTMREKLQSGEQFDAPALSRAAEDVLQVLAAAWTHRIVHRDIKPENLIVHQDTGKVWVLDFGIARHLDLTSLTGTRGLGIGTLGYSAPEQFKNLKREIDIRADLFSLGVTLYEAATGTNPLKDGAADAREMLHRLQTMTLPSIANIVGESFDEYIRLLTRRRADHRFKDPKEALEWLKSPPPRPSKKNR
jgi:serine/threonine-protein kinase